MSMRLCLIPFSGFYDSIHDSELDNCLERMFSDDSGDPIDALVSRAFDAVNWHAAHVAYAKQYAACFFDEFKIEGAEFESLNSPREYNFTTDRIFVNIPDSEIVRMHREVPRSRLNEVSAQMFTSRSGFASFYSPRVKLWKEIEAWDHNQIYALVCAYVLQMRDGEEFDSWAEFGLMERASCNGLIEEFISTDADPVIHRLWKVGDYLRQRESRKYRSAQAA